MKLNSTTWWENRFIMLSIFISLGPNRLLKFPSNFFVAWRWRQAFNRHEIPQSVCSVQHCQIVISDKCRYQGFRQFFPSPSVSIHYKCKLYDEMSLWKGLSKTAVNMSGLPAVGLCRTSTRPLVNVSTGRLLKAGLVLQPTGASHATLVDHTNTETSPRFHFCQVESQTNVFKPLTKYSFTEVICILTLERKLQKNHIYILDVL